MDIQVSFERLFQVLSSERFLKKRGMGNEIPVYIYAYDPREALETERRAKLLIERLAGKGVGVLAVNLYDLALDILRREGLLDYILAREAEKGRSRLQRQLRTTLLDDEAGLAAAIAHLLEDRQDCDIIFLQGLGEACGYLGAQDILGRLEGVCGDRPLLVFYPGEYRDEAGEKISMRLLGKIEERNYYRASNILTFQA